LLFSGLLLVGYALLTVAVRQGLGDGALLSAIARLALVLAIVNAAITLLVNPWRDDRPSDRFPAIVQDVTVIGIFALIGTVLLRETLLTTSAVGAVVVGFALQDTLGNLFAGLAIQIEKPFRVGQWIALGPDREGQVQEITWRATKLRTKAGQFLIIPNSMIAKEPVLNYSEPTVPTRVDVEIGASYESPPNDVKRAIHEALANAPLVMKAPEPLVTLKAFGASSLDYLVQFWIEDYAVDRQARDQVRTNIWYTFRRHKIEIPYPVQVQYEREELPVRTEQHVMSAAARLSAVDLFAQLDETARHALSRSADERLFAAGEAIVRQGATGDSMFVVLTGRVRVQLEPSGQEVAVIPAGGFFGEMSMLTGDARTATARAIDDVTVLEISAADFRELAVSNPALLDHVSAVVGSRRTFLEEARASATAVPAPEARQTFLARMRKFLHLKSAI
jgi:small-conductance mechanosensitive channel/CRP-like cAMP-binding protein